jgi:GntR family transcriptional regulator
MKLSPAVPMWRQVADHLRAQILDGTFPAGQVLPSEETLAREYGVSRPVIRDGIKTLVAEGFVEIRRPHGNLVRDPYAAPTRTEHAATTAGDWTDAEDPTFYRTNATTDHAELLAIPPGEPLLTREALQKSAGIHRYHRLYMPFSVAEHTPWADDPHLPPAPQAYERFTKQGHTLTWTEHVRARMPIGDETSTLLVPAGTPLIITLRLTANATDSRPLILEETRQRADQIQLAYTLRPHADPRSATG